MSNVEPSAAKSEQSSSLVDSLQPGQNDHSLDEHRSAAGKTVETPNADMLEDRVPEWAQLSRQAVIWTVILGILWMVLSYHQLWHTDLWGHLSYGRVIVEQKQIPATEPLMPLSKGVPMVDTAWLAQVTGYLFYSQWGVASLQFLYAASLFICVVALLLRFQKKTDSVAVCIIGLVVFGLVAYKSLAIIRPQLAGLACYVVMFSLLTRNKWPRYFWVVLPLLFAFWANVHGSFLLGLVVLGGLCLGRGLDVYRRTKSFKMVKADPKTQRLFVMIELAILATLLNPYGIGIYPAIHEISRHPNLTSLIEWEPLTLRMVHGKAMAAATIVLIILYRLTPRRVSFAEPILLIGLGLLAMWSVRMVVWWTPIAAVYTVLHLNAALKKYLDSKREDPEQESTRSGLNTVVTIGLAWIFFAYTPFGTVLLHGYPKEAQKFNRIFRRSVSPQTPVEITNYLHDHQPRGLIFNSYEWGDYLLWAGPENLQIFLNSHAHLVPRDVWLDYLHIASASSAWRDKLDRYGVNTVIIDHQYRSRLIRELKNDTDWKLEYEDNLGAIFLRKIPVLN